MKMPPPMSITINAHPKSIHATPYRPLSTTSLPRPQPTFRSLALSRPPQLTK